MSGAFENDKETSITAKDKKEHVMMESNRAKARGIAKQYLERGDPTGWFEALYSAANGDANMIPWADMVPNPNLVSWLDCQKILGDGKRALKIGCGLGDDAEELARRRFDVVAFDISETAIKWCNARFPESRVKYIVEDLFESSASWDSMFDFVLESYTLQVLPRELRNKAIAQIARFVAPGGTLLVICRGRDSGEHKEDMPWPLTKNELDAFKEHGLTEISFKDYMDQEQPPVRRFRIEYHR